MANPYPFGRRSKASHAAATPYRKRPRHGATRAASLLLVMLQCGAIAASAAELAAAGPVSPPELAGSGATRDGGFTLGVDASLRADQPRTGELAFETMGPSAPAGSPAPISLVDVRAIAVAMRQESPASAGTEPASSNGSFGKWMKRHWWVPVLVGAAVIAVAGESLYDDDGDDDDED